MQTTSNGFMIPDSPNSTSADKYSDIVQAIINNTNICNTTKGSLNASQSDYSQGWWKSTDGFIIQWGDPMSTIPYNGGQTVGQITFPVAFSHVCLSVVGSDAGGKGMSFGFYGLSKIGCTWCTSAGLGQNGVAYSPKYIAFGW